MRGDGFFVPLAVVFFAAAAIMLPTGRNTGGVLRTDEPAASATSDKPAAADADVRPANVETPETLLAQFFGEPLRAGPFSPDVIDRLRALADRHNYSIETVIVTLPDPIDSHSRWQFDLMQDAVQRAASAERYVLDRFYIPDWKAWMPEKDRKERGLLHESWPAVILFRRLEPRGISRLLVAQIVFETPTQGIHPEAFRRALNFASAWRNASDTIKILGPTFSGSSPSLAIGLRTAGRAGLLPGAGVTIVSGSATSAVNKAILEGALPDRRITYAATVLSSQDMLEGIVRHLRSNAELDPRRLALLMEQNTAYGQSTTSQHDAGKHADGESEDQRILEQALRIGFPLHVSRLRANADRIAAAASTSRLALPQTAPLQSLSLKDEGLITDQMPMFGEATSPAYVELVLVNILETLRRERVTTVGLIATDTRDKLFLSQMLVRYCPDVRVFMLETDLLYSHPDYSTYMRGAMIASSYPLFNANQLWSAPGDGERWRWQFATSTTQGIFNAFRVLVHDSSTSLQASLLDYASPFGAECPAGGCAPPLWISVNGSEGFWPVAAVPTSSTYIYRVPRDPTLVLSADRARMFPVPTWAVVVLLLLHAAVWVQVAGYAGSRISAIGERLPQAIRRIFTRSGQPRRYLFSAFAAIFLMAGFSDFLVWIWTSFVFEGSLIKGSLGPGALAAVTLLPLAAVMFDIARRRFPRMASPGADDAAKAGTISYQQWIFLYRAIFFALVGGVFVFLVVALLTLAGTVGGQPAVPASKPALLFFFNRAVNLGSGVSPAVPVLLLCGALYAWGFQHFRARGVPSRTLFRRRVADLEALRRCSGTGLAVSSDNASRCFSLDGLVPLRAVVFVGAVIIQAFWYVRGLDATGGTTLESWSYTAFFNCASVLLQALIAVSIVQFLFVWSHTRTRLEPLAGGAGVAGPLSAAFGRLPPSIRVLGVFTRVPRVRELEAVVARAETIQRFSLDAAGFPRGSEAILFRQPEFEPAAGCPSAADLRAALDADLAIDPDQTFSESTAWPTVVRFTSGARHRALAVHTLLDHDPPDAVKSWLERVDELVALDIVLVVRELSGRLVASMVLTLVLTMMVLVSHSWYPAQPRQVLLGFSWACILASVVASATVFVQMDRNELMSYISGTAANRVTWDVAFISKLLLWVVIPLLSLFAAQFPELGSTLLDWLKPVQKALP